MNHQRSPATARKSKRGWGSGTALTKPVWLCNASAVDGTHTSKSWQSNSFYFGSFTLVMWIHTACSRARVGSHKQSPAHGRSKQVGLRRVLTGSTGVCWKCMEPLPFPAGSGEKAADGAGHGCRARCPGSPQPWTWDRRGHKLLGEFYSKGKLGCAEGKAPPGRSTQHHSICWLGHTRHPAW